MRPKTAIASNCMFVLLLIIQSSSTISMRQKAEKICVLVHRNRSSLKLRYSEGETSQTLKIVEMERPPIEPCVTHKKDIPGLRFAGVLLLDLLGQSGQQLEDQTSSGQCCHHSANLPQNSDEHLYLIILYIVSNIIHIGLTFKNQSTLKILQTRSFIMRILSAPRFRIYTSLVA